VRQVNVLILLVLLAAAGPAAAGDPGAGAAAARPAIPPAVEGVFRAHCYACHGEKKAKGQVRLDAMPAMDARARLDLLNQIQEQVHFAAMPPEDERQPGPAERKLLADWGRGEVLAAGGSPIEDKLRYPDYGNAVDHD